MSNDSFYIQADSIGDREECQKYLNVIAPVLSADQAGGAAELVIMENNDQILSRNLNPVQAETLSDGKFPYLSLLADSTRLDSVGDFEQMIDFFGFMAIVQPKSEAVAESMDQTMTPALTSRYLHDASAGDMEKCEAEASRADAVMHAYLSNRLIENYRILIIEDADMEADPLVNITQSPAPYPYVCLVATGYQEIADDVNEGFADLGYKVVA